jgi:hypothetical protein
MLPGGDALGRTQDGNNNGDDWQVTFGTTDPTRNGRTAEAGVPGRRSPVAGRSVVVLGRAEAPS